MKHGMKTKVALALMAVSLPATALLHDASYAASASSLDAKREKVVQTALSLKNKVQYVHWSQRQEKVAPYKTDCSGYTYLVYRLANIGVTLVNRDDDDQANVGQLISKSNLKKGDLVFFWLNANNKRDVGHVAIYMGNGKIIHNAGTKNDVIISDLNSSYWKTRYIGARRVIY